MNHLSNGSIAFTLFLVAAPAAAQTPVDVVRVISKAVERQVKLPGEFQPYLAVSIYAKLPGFVKRVAVDRGSTVKEGQLLMVLEAPEMQTQIVEAQSKAQALGLQRAEAEAKLAGAQSTYDRLKAAFDGIITERNVHPGALVGPGTGSTPLLRLHQISRLRLVVAVPEALVGAMVKGARV